MIEDLFGDLIRVGVAELDGVGLLVSEGSGSLTTSDICLDVDTRNCKISYLDSFFLVKVVLSGRKPGKNCG